MDINVLAKYEGMTFDPEHCLETLEDCQCETAAAPPVDEPERSLEFLLLCSLSWRISREHLEPRLQTFTEQV